MYEQCTPTFSTALFDTAMDCVRFQQKRRCQFDSNTCSQCDFYIKNYIQVAPTQANLFMLQARRRVNVVRPVFAAIAVICLAIGILAAYDDHQLKVYKEQHTPTKVASTQAEQPKSQYDIVDDMIKSTLKEVEKKWSSRVDTNGDDMINCIDAAVWFYALYPKKANVRIVRNTAEDFNHLFNKVRIGNTWIDVEPQAYTKAWNTYRMKDIWKDRYNTAYAVDETKKWRVYAK
jgi:hypothetical protein